MRLKIKKGIKPKFQISFENFVNYFLLCITFLGIYLTSLILSATRGDFFKIVKYYDNIELKLSIAIAMLDKWFFSRCFINNMLFYVGIYLLLKIFIKSNKKVIGIEWGLSLIFGIINNILMDSRGIGFSINDIYFVSTAFKVLSAIKIRFTLRYLVVIPIIICVGYVLKLVDETKFEINTIKKKLYAFIASICMFACMCISITHDDGVRLWDINTAYSNLGTPTTLVASIIEEIKGFYKINEAPIYAKEFLSKYNADEMILNNNKHINVLYVLNEAFCDLGDIYEINANKDYLPFYHEFIKRDNVYNGVAYATFLRRRNDLF